MNKKILLATSIAFMLSACSNPQNVGLKNYDSLDHEIYTDSETMLLKRVGELAEKKLEDINSTAYTHKIKKEMLRSDAVYAYDKQEEALIENKKSDEMVVKPLFLEPKFAKVEIMAYETENGLYHEQQSVWLKVKEGEIVMKSNTNGSTAVDSFKSILGK